MAQVSNPQIVQLQTDLLFLGFPPGGIDGLVGPKTKGAAHDAAVQYKLAPPSGTTIPASFITDIHAKVLEIKNAPITLPPKLINLTRVAAAGWRKGPRAWADIYGATLHQTGCPLTDIPQKEIDFFLKNDAITQKDTPGLMRWAKQRAVDKDGQPAFDAQGNPIYVSLKCPFGITYSGIILQIHPVDVFGWHAQGQSHHNVGIEIAGFFAGVEGDPKTRPGGPANWKIQSVTPAQIEACKALLRYLAQLLRAHGSQLRILDPHRTATNDRQPDPGSKVWQLIAIPMMEELGLTTGGVTGKGMAIPTLWDPRIPNVAY